ncbi:unnamed protein product, partial [marine sediment metagenome]
LERYIPPDSTDDTGKLTLEPYLSFPPVSLW